MNDKSKSVIAPNEQFIVGGDPIGVFIKRSPKATYHALERGAVPGARKVAGRWILHVPTYVAHFTAPAA